ncbi:MAG: DUF4294 domain-containing protein [Muribaculaceae bacterium]|nr:DUF4294 domain-containing protein [Muribaculaceae bacterium]MBR5117043.1 DUF4294 domain-containing protein [Muribaculaceae bacterium]
MLLAPFANVARAQDGVIELPSVLKRAVAKWGYVVDEKGDTIYKVIMNTIIVYPPEKFKNKDEEELYWRTVRDVRKTLPYAKLINRTLQETYEYIETFPTQKEKEDYLKRFEKEVFNQYKPEMKKLTKNQGKTLIKLVNRETNQKSYYIIKAFMGTFRAGFWQTFGRFFGVNMRDGYSPSSNRKDAMLERICVRIEQGIL